jgi:hypothetical protein
VPGDHRRPDGRAGHFNQLEVPGQVNAMIERFLVVNGLSTPGPVT